MKYHKDKSSVSCIARYQQKFEYNTFDNSLGTLSEFEGKKCIKNLIFLLAFNSIGIKSKNLSKNIFF